MSKLLYQCLTKATNKEKGNPRRSQNWVFSKRAFFKLFDDHIECGNWNFLISEISNCIRFRTKYLFTSVSILQFDAKGETFQFAFNPWANPFKYFKLDYKEENISIKHSTFSIVLRIAIIIYILFYIWQKIK